MTKSTISLTVLVPSVIRSNSFSSGSWNVSIWDWRREALKKWPLRCCRRSVRTSWEHLSRTKTNLAVILSTTQQFISIQLNLYISVADMLTNTHHHVTGQPALASTSSCQHLQLTGGFYWPNTRDQPNSQFHGRDIFREIGLLPWKMLISVKSWLCLF